MPMRALTACRSHFLRGEYDERCEESFRASKTTVCRYFDPFQVTESANLNDSGQIYKSLENFSGVWRGVTVKSTASIQLQAARCRIVSFLAIEIMQFASLQTLEKSSNDL